ncbi:MAG: SGNH/GDSL hydrolase family protein [Acidobacteriota bacterium]
MTRLRNGLTNAGMVAASTVAMLVVCELILRIHNPLTSTVVGGRVTLRTNITTQVRLPPYPGLDPLVTVHRNALGFRGADPPARLDATLSVIAVGGSTTESAHITEGLTWPDQLAARLSASFRPFWLNNAGLSGHSTFGNLILVNDYVVPLKPNVVLYLVGINDIGRSDLNRWDRSMVDSDAVRRIEPHSQLLQALLTLWRTYQARRVGLGHAHFDFQHAPQITSPAATVAKKQNETSAALPEFDTRVRQLIALARAANIQPVLITQTTVVGGGVDDVSGKDLRRIPWSEDLDGELYWAMLERYNDVLRQVGAQTHTTVIDLAAHFPHSSRYYFDLIHYNVEGSREAARIVYNALCPYLAQTFPSYQHAACATW